jgi:hypothetical protein
MIRVPEIDQISAEWLTEILRRHGASITVRRVSVSRVGTGQAAACCRILVEYDDPQPNLPSTIIGKFAAEDLSSRQAGREQKTYLREVNFYRYLQSRLSIRTPICHHAEIEEDDAKFVILLEDLAPAEQGDQIIGCKPDLARKAVLELVGLHAPSWRNASMLGLDWLGDAGKPGRSRAIMQMYRKALPNFLDRCTDGLSVEELDLVRRIAEYDDFPSEYPLLEIYCLTHNDYRVDNLLIDDRPQSASLHVVDWQTFGVGNPMKDVAYFLGGCLLPNDRAAIEKDLLGEYHGQMREAGVADYDWDQCWADYRRASFHGIMTAIAGTYFVTQTERGDRLFSVMAQRHARQALDIGACDLLA